MSVADEPDDVKLYTTAQVAELCQVVQDTVRTWINEGKLKAIKLENVWRVRRSDLREFLNERYTA